MTGRLDNGLDSHFCSRLLKMLRVFVME
jgi:hypothetical protein